MPKIDWQLLGTHSRPQNFFSTVTGTLDLKLWIPADLNLRQLPGLYIDYIYIYEILYLVRFESRHSKL